MKLLLLFYHPPLLLLTITVIFPSTSSSSSGSEGPIYKEAYYKYLGSSYSYIHLLKTSDDLIQDASLVKCTAISLERQTEFFSYNQVQQICKIYSPKNIMTVTSGQNTNEMPYYRRNGWIKVYALSMGAASLVYNSIINQGSPSTWKVEECVGNFCPNFFRHPILDIWKELPIDEVKLVIYKNQTDVVTMVFNGRNESITSWFNKTNVKSTTPWTDFGTFSHFSMVGIEGARRFYVSNMHNGCPGDKGWLTINERFLSCNWEKSNFFPTILYSNLATKVTWSKGHGIADAMAIYIRLIPQ